MHLGTPSKQVVFDVARYISVRVVSGGKDLGFGVGAVHGHREHEPDGVELHRQRIVRVRGGLRRGSDVIKTVPTSESFPGRRRGQGSAEGLDRSAGYRRRWDANPRPHRAELLAAASLQKLQCPNRRPGRSTRRT